MEFSNNYFDYKKDNNLQLIIYNNGQLEIPLKVVPKEDTIWATASVIAVIFETTERNVNMHIQNLYKDGEIEKDTSVQKMHRSPDQKNPNYRPPVYYNLDVIISVGYRVHSKRGIVFRR